MIDLYTGIIYKCSIPNGDVNSIIKQVETEILKDGFSKKLYFNSFSKFHIVLWAKLLFFGKFPPAELKPNQGIELSNDQPVFAGTRETFRTSNFCSE